MGKEVTTEIIRKTNSDHFKPITPVISLVKSLRKHYKIILLTNSTVSLESIYEKYKIHENFDIIMCSHKLKLQKPSRAIFRLLIKKSRVNPKEILFIDDLERNTKAAEKLGIKTILFKNPKELKKDLKEVGIKKYL